VRKAASSTPTVRPIESIVAVTLSAALHAVCAAKTASWNGQNFPCAAAHMAASAMGTACRCDPSG